MGMDFKNIDRLLGQKSQTLSQRRHAEQLAQRLRNGDDAVQNNPRNWLPPKNGGPQ